VGARVPPGPAADREPVALKRRRGQDRYVWAHEARGACVGFPACPGCLDEDAKAGRDHYLRRHWLRVEALLCARHGLFLVEDCGRCGARGFGFNLLDGAARLVCRRCGAVIHQALVESSEPSRGEKAVLAALGATPPDDDAMATARLLWSLPRPGMARRPLLFWLVGHPRSARGMARDRAAPLSTASLDWRRATWIGVAQLLDRAGAREVFGPPRFALAQLKAWTRSRRLSPPRARMLRPAA
jgi:hypothetical protein